MVLDVMQISKILPHRYPFLLVDRVTEFTKSEGIVGYKNISISDHVFQGHFPDHPIYPGVLIIEGMAQAGGVLAFLSSATDDQESFDDKVVYFMSIDKAKFRQPVKPGDKLEYRMKVIKQKGAIWSLEGKAYVDQTMVAQAELMALIVDK